MYGIGAQKTISLTEHLEWFRGSLYFLVVSSWTKFGCKEDVRPRSNVELFNV